MINELINQLFGIPYPPKKPFKRSKKKKRHSPIDRAYLDKMDRKMRKDLTEAYGRLATDMFDEYKED
jgi:hypothetical protein